MGQNTEPNSRRVRLPTTIMEHFLGLQVKKKQNCELFGNFVGSSKLNGLSTNRLTASTFLETTISYLEFSENLF